MADEKTTTTLWEWINSGVSQITMPSGTILAKAVNTLDSIWENMYNSKETTDSKLEYNTYLEGMSNLLYENVNLGNVGIFGVPYQFNQDADVPLGKVYGGNGYAKYIGRAYEENILLNCPVVYFQVGKPDFLGGKDTGVGTILLSSLLDGADELLNGDGDSVLEYTGNELNKLNYYTFADCFDEYASYVNTMARYVAIRMGIGDKVCANQKGNDTYAAFDIMQFRDRLLGSSYDGYDNWQYNIPLYCNVQATSVSESAANTVGDSALASTLQQGSQMAKEINFLLGSGSAMEALSNSTITNTFTSAIEGIVGTVSKDSINGFLRNASNGVSTVISGANLLFPSIWQDSTFTKSYSISAKFTTPYGDPESIFLDVYVPYLCLLALTLPRQATQSGYTSPFLVKAHSKGYFNCDMGLVESMEIRRGGQSGQEWTIDGFPTELEVTISLRDLYPAIVITKAKSTGFMFSSNTGLTSYLSMMAGVNLCKMDPFANIAAGFKMLGATYANLDNLFDIAENKLVRLGYKGIVAVYKKLTT